VSNLVSRIYGVVMNGHIRELSPGRFLIRISAGRDVLTGSRKQPSRVVRGTHRDAELALAHLLVTNHRGEGGGLGITLQQLFTRWQQSPKRNGQSRAYTSLYNDKKRFDRYILPGFGSRNADKISGAELARLYDELLVRANLSPRSVLHIHAILRAMYEWGMRRDLVANNPTKKVVAPSVRLCAPEVPERDTVITHLARIGDDDLTLKLVIGLASVYGLRRSELVGLKWESVDLMERRIRVIAGVTRVPALGTQVTPTKTGHQGFAEFSLDSRISKDLQELYARNAAVRVQVGLEATLEGYVFSPDPTSSTPCSPDRLSQLMRRHCKRNTDQHRPHHHILLPKHPNPLKIASNWPHGNVHVGINPTDNDIRRAATYISHQFKTPSPNKNRFRRSQHRTPQTHTTYTNTIEQAHNIIHQHIPPNTTTTTYDPHCGHRTITYWNPHTPAGESKT